MTAYKRDTKDLFVDWDWAKRYPNKLEEWVTAFFNSLSSEDQKRVTKAIGGNLTPYLRKKVSPPKLPKGSKASLGDILNALQNPPKPKFLSDPPPWRMN